MLPSSALFTVASFPLKPVEGSSERVKQIKNFKKKLKETDNVSREIAYPNVHKKDVIQGAEASWALMTSCGGRPTALACHLTKK